jgi:hypothetical protein
LETKFKNDVLEIKVKKYEDARAKFSGFESLKKCLSYKDVEVAILCKNLDHTTVEYLNIACVDGSFKIIVESIDNALDKEELIYVG